MKTVVLTALAVILAAAIAAAALIYSGAYNVAATDRHWDVTHWIMETARVRSIKAHAAGIAVPVGFDEQPKVVAAVGHFSEHCAVCHGAPGDDRRDLAAGMYPQPPDLNNVSKRYTPAELFWILKNGIKMSGMPSMADDGDDLLWATVGFLERLPGMTPDDYNDLWMASQAQSSGHQHMMNMGGMNMHGMSMEGGDQAHGDDRYPQADEQPTTAGQSTSDGQHGQ